LLQHFEHVGMATGDLDRALAFYVDLLGMELVLRKNVRAAGGPEVAFLAINGVMVLEILKPSGEMTGPARDLPNSEVGIRHIALSFENIDATYERLLAAGVVSVEKPRDAYNREILARVAFVKDPDGNIVELVQH